MQPDTPPVASGPTMRSLRERQREERAALILSAAQDVFVEKGYYDASIDEIAARAGVAKGTVYLHFASKEDLLVALVEQQISGFLARVDQVIGEAAPVRVRLEHILLDVYTRMHEKRNQVLLELHSMGVTRSVIEKRGEFQARIKQVMERIAVLLEEGKRNGELDAAVPTPVMVATFVTLMSPGGYEQLLAGGLVSPAELVGYVSRIFFPPETV
ncbi:MAG TPA: TetR/AcrR family transcriptional regulator [Roseiflexaceae bacterium]|nr:TetR/AcrR family transcriptional regulator [Roseiflexaceae bacterium]